MDPDFHLLLPARESSLLSTGPLQDIFAQSAKRALIYSTGGCRPSRHVEAACYAAEKVIMSALKLGELCLQLTSGSKLKPGTRSLTLACAMLARLHRPLYRRVK